MDRQRKRQEEDSLMSTEPQLVLALLVISSVKHYSIDWSNVRVNYKVLREISSFQNCLILVTPVTVIDLKNKNFKIRGNIKVLTRFDC